ncbi:MAG: type II CRISPR-associated endonuclease Cas1 [Phycisphaerales bacterium]|nr:type II CRISPR-associated endonuclease Cas1 [Phycisphaerales bacterium]
MLKRSIEISRHPAHLAVEHGQLLILRPGERKQDARFDARIPCEDIALVVTDHREVTFSHSALVALAEHGASLVVCGADHLPAAILLPVSGHTEVAARMRDQMNAGAVLPKQLWKRIVVAKVRAQAGNLDHAPAAQTRLLALARRVRSGDAANVEAQAARTYWGHVFSQRIASFRRVPGERECPNNLLDYGYAVLRAAVARALIGAGLHPTLGISHSNRSNTFALADDLMEPLRPLVDRRARELMIGDDHDLDQLTKAQFIRLQDATVRTEAGIGPLTVALARYAASLARCFASGNDALLDIPAPVWSGEALPADAPEADDETLDDLPDDPEPPPCHT